MLARAPESPPHTTGGIGGEEAGPPDQAPETIAPAPQGEVPAQTPPGGEPPVRR